MSFRARGCDARRLGPFNPRTSERRFHKEGEADEGRARVWDEGGVLGHSLLPALGAHVCHMTLGRAQGAHGYDQGHPGEPGVTSLHR